MLSHVLHFCEVAANIDIMQGSDVMSIGAYVLTTCPRLPVRPWVLSSNISGQKEETHEASGPHR